MGVTVRTLNVGGMTAEDAEALLSARFQKAFDDKTIRLMDGDKEAAVYSFADLGFRFNFSRIIDEAMSVGRDSAARRVRIAMPWSKPVEISTLPTCAADEEKIKKELEKIAPSLNFDAVNAGIAYDNGKFNITPGAEGRRLDIKKTVEAVKTALENQRSGSVPLFFEKASPAHPTEEFAYDIKLLGKYETHFAEGKNDPRYNNIKTAAGRINNQVLFPGEVFSAGTKMGSGTPDNGYARAVVLVNGKPTEDWGGGVCQVVTALYNAALQAELDILERHNHSVKVSYADYGFDATVAGDYYDLKFKNGTPKPVVIVSEVDGGKLTISIYGQENRAGNRRVEFEAKLVETVPPEPEKVTYDKTVPRGEIWVTVLEQDGYKYELYKKVFINGALAETVKINTSAYKPVRGEVLQREDY